MKRLFIFAICLIMSCLAPATINAQIKTEKTGTTNNIKWTMRYPGFCNLASSNEKIADEIKDLLKKRQKQFCPVPEYRGFRQVERLRSG